MRIWPTSSGRSAPLIQGSEPPLRLLRRPGHWRARRHLALAPLAVWCGWSWFGWDGAVLLAIWWWWLRPGAVAPGYWEIDPARVCRARPGRWRTRLCLHGRATLEIFHDELSAVDAARLRRVLKRQLAAG